MTKRFTYKLFQPDLTAIRTYFTRWLIRTNSYDLTRTNSYDFAKSYVFYELPIRMNLYEWPTPNPAPKPYPSLGFRQIVQNRTSEVVLIRTN